MTFETLVLRGLFGACILVCGLTLAAMVTAKPAPLAINGSASTLIAATPSICHDHHDVHANTAG